MDFGNANSENDAPANGVKRRTFLKQASLVVAGVQASVMLPSAPRNANAATAPSTQTGGRSAAAIVDTTSGKVRGTVVDGIRVFKGLPYGGTTAGKNRFMPPTKPAKWTGIRDAANFGHIAPQTTASGRIDY